jgi:hypothetical protein
MWFMLGVPAVLLLLFVWQVVSPLLKTEIVVREPVTIARVSLEPDPSGARIDFVVVDRMGQDTTADGSVSIKLREPDGAVWQINRSLTAADFAPLPAGDLLNGRLGSSIVVPTSAWARPPRHGGSATVSVSIQPGSGSAPITAQEETRYP